VKPYLLVSGDFVPTGGMDRANFALAAYLADRGHEVHLAAHRVADELLARPAVVFHRVPKPFGSYFLSAPLLDRVGRHWASRLADRGGRVVVNGGNCRAAGVNWVHYVHAAYPPCAPGPASSRASLTTNCQLHLRRWKHRDYLAKERQALAVADLVIANSERTRRDLVELVGVPPERVHVVYLAGDARLFRPPGTAERAALRAHLGLPDAKPVLAFVGAPGDHRKGFDTLFAAWQVLCKAPDWDAALVVAGAQAGVAEWQARAAAAGIASRIHFLGFRRDLHDVLRACDALVAPARYEAYGLAVHEALCCGLPALVSQVAGVAERFPAELQALLLPDPEDVSDLVNRLRGWRAAATCYHAAALQLGEALRGYTWEQVAQQIVTLIETAPCRPCASSWS
jgi:glycosyltransferase involved in cell wall biosynthesis